MAGERSWMLADTRGHLRGHSRRLAAIKTPRRSENVRARTIVEKARTVLEVHGRFAEARGRNRKLPRTPAVCIRKSRNCAGKSRIPRVERVNAHLIRALINKFTVAPSDVRHECYYDVIKHECRMARVLDNLRLHEC